MSWSLCKTKGSSVAACQRNEGLAEAGDPAAHNTYDLERLALGNKHAENNQHH